MAESVCSKKQRKGRNQNFTLTETNIIQNQVRLHPILESKLFNTVTNQKKQSIWKDITSMVNAAGVTQRSIQEVKDKWRNMCRDAKFKFAEHSRESKRTGGGPPPAPLSQSVNNIINMYKDTSSFRGITGGLETSIIAEPECNAVNESVDVWEDALSTTSETDMDRPAACSTPSCSYSQPTFVVIERPPSPDVASSVAKVPNSVDSTASTFTASSSASSSSKRARDLLPRQNDTEFQTPSKSARVSASANSAREK